MSKSVLITGATGQDGSYLIELLLEKGYEVYGLARRSANFNPWRVEHLLKDITIIYGDLLDTTSLCRALKISKPDEVYNLAAQSHVGESFKQPQYTAEVTGKGVLNLLDSIKDSEISCKLYQASSSELYGKVIETPQNELTPFNPRSPYGVAKAYGHYIAINYRESYGMFNCCGILFNHESSRRGIEFVTRKITDGVARIKYGLQKELKLGNLDSKRDWGHAKDYVYAMYLMLQQGIPDDYVVATGETRSVREFCEIAFKYVGLNYEDYVSIDPQFFRPAEVDVLLGDPSKIRTKLGWAPKLTFKDLVVEMVEADLKRVKESIR
jgi:GDPmannose 4,6-dehydratase